VTSTATAAGADHLDGGGADPAATPLDQQHPVLGERRQLEHAQVHGQEDLGHRRGLDEREPLRYAQHRARVEPRPRARSRRPEQRHDAVAPRPAAHVEADLADLSGALEAGDLDGVVRGVE
jgi:hypothetical protein